MPPARQAPPHIATAPRSSAPAGVAPLPVRTRHRWAWRLARWSIMAGIWGALVLAGIVLWFSTDLPRPEAALDATRRPSLTLQDRSGQIIATFGDMVGEPLHLRDLPAYLPRAVVATEDRRFFHHYGIDLIGMARAAWVNASAGRVVQGGSTLTQQLAKTLFLTNARTIRRKVQELLLTLWLEHRFSKQQILEIYLNRVYLGAGAWGVDAAAHQYFGVSARRVTLWQAAVLAGLPRAPSRFNPRVNAQAATARGREVLALMAQAGDITEDQAHEAAAQIAFTAPAGNGAGWFSDWVADQTAAVLPEGRDATLRTTLDHGLQAVAEARLAGLLDAQGASAGVGQGAVVVMDAATGAVRAMVGGRDYRAGAFNRAVLARRQPGSAFKPFTWLTAIEHGKRPEDLVLDGPIRIGSWQPVNFERRYQGEVTLEDALAESLNTVAVRLLMASGGPKAVAAVAARLGIADKLPNDASLALGTGEVGLLELTASYAAFFNGGKRVTPYGLEKMPGHAEPVQVIDTEAALLMERMLGAVVTRGTGRSAAVAGRVVAGKTGTTQDSRDAWFVGAVNGTLIGVWLGNDDATAMKGVTGSGLPARLFHEIAVAVR
jgi:penicillin-binding protein 1A